RSFGEGVVVRVLSVIGENIFGAVSKVRENRYSTRFLRSYLAPCMQGHRPSIGLSCEPPGSAQDGIAERARDQRGSRDHQRKISPNAWASSSQRSNSR